MNINASKNILGLLYSQYKRKKRLLSLQISNIRYKIIKKNIYLYKKIT